MKKSELIHSSAAEYLTFIAASGDTNESFEIRYEDENIWLTQKMMAALYDADVRTIARLRCLDGLEWQEIAKRLGGSYTDSSAKKKFYRYFSKLDEKD